MRKTHRIIHFIVVIFLACCLTESCAKAIEPRPDPKNWPIQDWQPSAPEAQGMDSTILAQMFESIQKENIRLHSLLVVRKGYLVAEAYWDPYNSEDNHTIQSITKSVVGTLVGITIAQGALDSVDQKMVDFFSSRPIQSLNEQKKSITLQNLLSMTPGLTCQDQSSSGQGMYQA
jgi:CubicO group peptidase (beta-lactamase class C family)